ncbi:hypothetical protein FOZ62_029051, partial [Perkinsus olseni]
MWTALTSSVAPRGKRSLGTLSRAGKAPRPIGEKDGLGGEFVRALGIHRRLTAEETNREEFRRFSNRVGIQEYISPKGSGGFLRGQMTDWEVREVGMDGKVAHLRVEPVTESWTAVERRCADHLSSAPAIDSRTTFKAADRTHGLLMAFDQGYELGDIGAAPFLERHCGAHAVSEVQKFLHRTALKKSTRNARGLLCRFPRVDGDDDLETVYNIRGAIAWMIRKTLAVIPMKILSHEVLFYAAAEASRNKCLLDTMPREEAIELMRFVVRGFSDGGMTIRLNRGSNAEVFCRELKTHFGTLEVSTVKETTVLLSWKKKHSPVGLFNSRRWKFVLKKTGWDTNALQRAIEQKLKLPNNSLHYGGTKDRFGVTYQYMTLPATHDEQQIREAFDDISAGPMKKCEVDHFVVNTGPSKLRQGLSLGNCFRVQIRGAKRGVVEALSSVESGDFINYYGLQRFGINPNHEMTRHCNIDIGGAIISGQYEKALRLIMSPVCSDRTAAAE